MSASRSGNSMLRPERRLTTYPKCDFQNGPSWLGSEAVRSAIHVPTSTAFVECKDLSDYGRSSLDIVSVYKDLIDGNEIDVWRDLLCR